MSTASRCDSALPVSAVTTIEGIGASPAGAKMQKAWLELEVIQCGYCPSGQIMSATALPANTPNPDDSDIDAAMAENICGPHPDASRRSKPCWLRKAWGLRKRCRRSFAPRVADRRSGGRVSARVSSAGARGQRAGAAARYSRRQIRARCLHSHQRNRPDHPGDAPGRNGTGYLHRGGDARGYLLPSLVNMARSLSHHSIRTPFLRMAMLC